MVYDNLPQEKMIIKVSITADQHPNPNMLLVENLVKQRPLWLVTVQSQVVLSKDNFPWLYKNMIFYCTKSRVMQKPYHFSKCVWVIIGQKI